MGYPNTHVPHNKTYPCRIHTLHPPQPLISPASFYLVCQLFEFSYSPQIGGGGVGGPCPITLPPQASRTTYARPPPGGQDTPRAPTLPWVSFPPESSLPLFLTGAPLGHSPWASPYSPGLWLPLWSMGLGHFGFFQGEQGQRQARSERRLGLVQGSPGLISRGPSSPTLGFCEAMGKKNKQPEEGRGTAPACVGTCLGAAELQLSDTNKPHPNLS